MNQGGTGPARSASDEGNDVYHIVPGSMAGFTELYDNMAPLGNGFDRRQWLEIEQRTMFDADADQFHSFVTKTAKEQCARCVEVVEPGKVK